MNGDRGVDCSDADAEPTDRDALQRNIALAESLGQTARTRLEILWKGSTLNRFLEEVRDAAVQVVPLGSGSD